MRHYSSEIKEAAIQRMMPPQNQSIPTISNEMGIPVATLYLWRNKARHDGQVIPSKGRGKDRWSAQDKFRMVVDTMHLPQQELSAYCRKQGLYPEQIESWREVCLQANATEQEKKKLQKLHDKAQANEIRTLKKELRRKEKALAETAALLILQKKAAAIWGEEEDV